MSLKRSIRLLTSSERQLLKTQWLRSGQCARCFHASIQQRAEEKPSDGNDQGTPYNAPRRGPSRQERSAKISNELSMLQKGPPPSGDLTGPGSATGAYHAPPQAPTSSAGFLETPDEMGGPRMGENVSAGREGPNAQGVGRPIRYEDRGDTPQDTTNMARGVRATGKVEEPAEGGASVLGGDRPNPGHHQEWIDRSARDDTPWNPQQESRLRTKIQNAPPTGTPIRPKSHEAKHLLQRSAGASTIAAQNFAGVIRDRVSSISSPSSLTQQPLKKRHMKPEVRTVVIDKFVRGTYDPNGHLVDDKFKQATLNDVARLTMLNGTFLPKDGEKVVKRVQSLLPAAVPPQRQQKQARK